MKSFETRMAAALDYHRDKHPLKSYIAQGIVKPYRELPPEHQQALAHYMAYHGEAWDPSDPTASLKQEMPHFTQAYGDTPFGMTEIPMSDLTQAIIRHNPDVSELGEGNWDKYHQWYLNGRDIPDHDITKPLWPVILSSGMFSNEVIQDGWHRLNDYYRKGVQNVPAVYFP